jgi:hypothetical protein
MIIVCLLICETVILTLTNTKWDEKIERGRARTFAREWARTP